MSGKSEETLTTPIQGLDLDPAADALSPAQVHALFDILTHHETYHEIEEFKKEDAVTKFGYPFKEDTDESDPSASPVLQMLLRFVLTLPGVSQLSQDFWEVRAYNLLRRLGEADLSESYDKGAMGTRKVLGTGSSSVLEMLARGALGGLDRSKDQTETETYKFSSAKDLERAWNNVLDGLVYGDLVDGLFDQFKKTDDFESFSPTIEAAVKYIVFHLATILHYVFVLSPEGQYLLKLIENAHNLIPYMMVRQTLKVGNAATMINGLANIFLAKLSVTSVTNWFGLTKNEDDGMNLLQHIISLVLSWDAMEFQASANAVKKGDDKPSPAMLQTIKTYVEDESREKHEAVRQASLKKHHSIVTALLRDAAVDEEDMSKMQHKSCMHYYSALLSVRDRERISAALCKTPPDMLTKAVRDAVAAYDPIIRKVHENVDLSAHLSDLQAFIDEFIKTSKPKKTDDKSNPRLPSVEDYVDLLMSNRHRLYKWIYALGSKSPGVWEDLRTWSNKSIVKFRKPDETTNGASAAGDMNATLCKLYASLDEKTRASIVSQIDQHATYLDEVNKLSEKRFKALVKAASSANGSSNGGPGVYLARWLALLDETVISACKRKGSVRHGKDVKHHATMGKKGVGGQDLERESTTLGPDAPDISAVVSALGGQFKKEVQRVAATKWQAHN